MYFVQLLLQSFIIKLYKIIFSKLFFTYKNKKIEILFYFK